MSKTGNIAAAIGLSVAMVAMSDVRSAAFTIQNDQPERKREFRYAITVVPGLGGASDSARGMNDQGHIVGDALDPVTSEKHPYFWDGANVYDLGTFGGDRGVASDVNNRGWVVGWAQRPGLMHSHAFLWKGEGEIEALMEPDGTLSSGAYAINDREQIVGTIQPRSGPRFTAVLWEDEQFKSINTLGEDIQTEGRDINEDGFAIGVMGQNPYDAVVFLWNGRESIPIRGSLGSEIHAVDARSINAARSFVGSGQVDLNNRNRPLAYRKGSWHNLLRPITRKGFDRGMAWDVNDRNQIVGTIRYGPLDAFFGFIAQAGDGIQILNDFLPPHNRWAISSASAINNHGQIAATGESNEPPAGTYALLLTPVKPELTLEFADGPLRADEVNTFTITDAQPGATIKFFYGKRGGGKRIPGCDALAAMTQIDDPVAFGEAIADADGHAELEIYIPPRGAVHWGFLIQAVDFQNCEESQLVVKRVE